MTLKLPVADVLCLYGMPTAQLRKELLVWLRSSEERYVVILEEEAHFIAEALSNPSPRLLYCDVSAEDGAAMRQLCWKLVFLQFVYLQINDHDPQAQSALEKMQGCQQQIHLIASDFEDRGLCRLKNAIHNTPFMKEAKEARALFGAFKGTPAIICGAGPSLEQNQETLKEMEHQALILAGGTALSVLSLMGIRPHLAAAIDPHPLSKRYFHNHYFDVPFLFQSRVNSAFLRQMQGDLLFVPGSENDFFETETFEGGWNVATFLTRIALCLGCDPIILTGVDLEKVEGKSYALELEEDKGAKLDWFFAKKWLEERSTESSVVISRDMALAKKGEQSDLRGKLHALLTQIEKKDLSKIDPNQLKQECALVYKNIGKMLKILESLFPSSPEKHGGYALLQIEIEQTELYRHFLSSLWNVWKHVFLRKIPEGVPRAYGIELNQWLFMQGICDDAQKI